MSKTIVLTRPAPQCATYADELADMFGDRVACTISPLLEIKPIDDMPDFTGVQAVLFTSANGVRTLSKMQGVMPNIPCFCVGDKTAIEARSIGFEAFSAKGGADDLVHLASTILSPENGPILYISGKIAVGDIADKLSRHGFKIVEHVIYEQVPLSLTVEAKDMFASDSVDILPMFSPMTAKLLAAELRAHPKWRLDKIDVICLSSNVRKQLHDLDFGSVITVDTPTADAMSAEIGSLLRR